MFVGDPGISTYEIERIQSYCDTGVIDIPATLKHAEHFYDKEEVSKTVFKGLDGKPWKLHEVLYAYGRMFKSYWEINDYIKGKNINIINKSPNSFIDAFKKD